MFKRFLIFAAAAFVLIAFTFQFPRIRNSASSWSQSLFRPFLESASILSAQAWNVRNQFYDYWNAIDKQHEQEQQIEELESRLVHLDEVLLENSRLKSLLDFRDTLPQKAVGVRIIGYGLKPWKKSVLLNKGSSQGIKNTSVLVVPSGLVGRIVDVSLLSSQAILLTDPESRVTAMTLTSRAQGIVEGNGNEKLKLRYLNLDDPVQVGEIVVTSGLSDIFPKGLRVGRIEAVQRDPDGLHLSATVKPAVRFSKVEEMLCLEPSESK